MFVAMSGLSNMAVEPTASSVRSLPADSGRGGAQRRLTIARAGICLIAEQAPH